MSFRPQDSITIKLFAVGVLIFICLVPSLLIWALLTERTDRQNEVKKEITEKWGSSQIIAGPILTLPYTRVSVNSEGLRFETSGVLNILPQKLSHNATIDPEVRSRGIFDAVVYKTKVDGHGNFTFPDLERLGINSGDIKWDKAYISIAVSDTRGIAQQINVQWNDSNIPFEPGAKNAILGDSGIHAFTPIDTTKKFFAFAYSFDLQGSDQFEFLPLGNETRAEIKSNWASPSFIGAYLPNERDVADEFSAAWSISSFGRSYPQQWLDKEVEGQSILHSRFGVSFIQEVDFYTQINRTIKYAVMFIAVTFLAFFLFEVMSKLRIHPFQYLLVGFALALFYLLLLSLSERIGFLPSYVVSTFAITGIITGYSVKVLRANKKALIIAALLLLLYSYLYIIVQLEDLALISGSILLFVLLALTMYLTRNIDWYQLDTKN